MLKLTPTQRAKLATWGRAGIEGMVGQRNAHIFCRAHGLFGTPKTPMAVLGREWQMSRQRVHQVVLRTAERLGL